MQAARVPCLLQLNKLPRHYGKESRMATIAEDTTRLKNPKRFLNTVVGRPVVVKPNNGVLTV